MTSRHVERGRVFAQDEVGVGREDDAVQFERERVGVFVGGELVLFERGDDELADHCREPALERGDPFLDRPGAGAHLEDRAGEEAATGKGAAREVVEERVAHGDELREPGGGGERRFDDLGLEDPSRLRRRSRVAAPASNRSARRCRSCSCRARRRGCRSRGLRVRRPWRATPPHARWPPASVRRRRVACVHRSR